MVQGHRTDIMTGKPMDELTGKLHRAVEAGLRNEKWSGVYERTSA